VHIDYEFEWALVQVLRRHTFDPPSCVFEALATRNIASKPHRVGTVFVALVLEHRPGLVVLEVWSSDLSARDIHHYLVDSRFWQTGPHEQHPQLRLARRINPDADVAECLPQES